MVRSLYSGVSGLTNHQTRMDVIGNNIANVNTYGFKTFRVTFRDVLGQNTRSASAGAANTAGNNPGSVGYGMQVGSIDRDMSMSSFQSTNKTLDLAISGDGFFVTTSFASSPTGGSPLMNQSPQELSLTRMGNFGVDSLGRLVTADNRFVMGQTNSIYGLFQTGSASSTALAEEELTDVNGDRQVTSADYTWNNVLNINQAIQRAYNIHTDSAGVLYKYQMVKPAVAASAGPPAVPAQPAIYEDPSAEFMEAMWADENNDGYMDADIDQNGELSSAEEAARVTAIASERTMPDGTVLPAIAPPAGMTFQRVSCDLSGNMLDVSASNPIKVKLPGMAEADPPVEITSYQQYAAIVDAIERIRQENATTAAEVQAALDMEPKITWTATGDPAATPPTVGLGTAPTAATADEYLNRLVKAAGEAGLKVDELRYSDLSAFTIEQSGVISVNYNSQLKAIGRIEIGVVDNPEGLEQAGNTSYTETGASGIIKIKQAGSEGAGGVQSGKLEMSNVNLATEFSDMIVTQRGYQANSRIITVSDSMLEELVNLKR
ncbi:MAG: flagellar hook-basal body complex protein [Ruminococcus sp.]|jgi:flagellar hook protein FlgE|nr:flagellar hook-basal body complex protein [Ruminococcus sp.]